MEPFNKQDEVFLEELAKKCPRCGGKSANPSNSSGRCKACLKKLSSMKKKPGNYLHEHKVADDALRRQKGKNGTAHKKSKGLGSRKAIIKKVHEGEKKAGQVLSPDRKDNSKGYSSSNTRMVPKELNRGRHHVDGKKLAAWRKRKHLKKTLEEYDPETLYTFVLAKAHQAGTDTATLDLLEAMEPADLIDFINNLEKGAEAIAEQQPTHMPTIHQEVGKTHTVEIHPDIDHLYNVKAHVVASGGKAKIGDIKKRPEFAHIADRVPRDAKGNVTPEGIDKHIESLPKKKVNVRIMPYNMKAQQHRGLASDKTQYVASMELHPETLISMSPDKREAWNSLKERQHSFDDKGGNQFAWTRIDPWKAEEQKDGERANLGVTPNHNHWHLDEIQSDFQTADKINRALGEHAVDEHPAKKDIQEILSHGHDDPQHAAHSVVNALGRKLGIESMSMDTPKDQAKQSNLVRELDEDNEEHYSDYKAQHHPDAWKDQLTALKDGTHNSLNNPYFKSALDKIGGHDALTKLADASSGTGSSVDVQSNADSVDQREPDPEHKKAMGEYEAKSKANPYWITDKEGNTEKNPNYVHHDWPEGPLARKIKQLSEQEKDALNDMIWGHDNNLHSLAQDAIYGDTDSEGEMEIPVHQKDTYDKRPKKLGYKLKDKKEVLGNDPRDRQDEVQYAKLYKKILEMRSLMKEKFTGYGENTLHGWISPKGEYRPMGDNELHDEALFNHLGLDPHSLTTEAYSKAIAGAHNDGWISVGHGGGQNAAAAHHVLSDRKHPAAATLRQLASKHWDSAQPTSVGLHYPDREQSLMNLDTNKFMKHGTLKAHDDLKSSIDEDSKLKKADREYVYRAGARGENSVPFKARCHHCDKTHSFNVDIKTYNKWNEGGGVDALRPHMNNRDIKEIAKDGMCGGCKDKMHAESDTGKNMEKFAKAYVEKYQPLEKSTEASLFKRFEDKYILPLALKEELDRTLNKHLAPDYPDKKTKYTVMKSVYFDSNELDMVKHHLSKAQSRFKIRTREYAPNGKLHKSDFTYLEVKAKHGNVSDKFRIKVPNDSMGAFVEGKPLIADVKLAKANPHIGLSDLVKRVDDLNSAMKTFSLRPSCEVTYARNAYSDGNPDGLRVTYDQGVNYNVLGNSSSSLSKNDPDIESMISGYDPSGHVILEVKHHGHKPDWLTQFLAKNNVAQTSFSKYCWSMGKHAKRKI